MSTEKKAQCQGAVKKWRGGSLPLRALLESEAGDCDRKKRSGDDTGLPDTETTWKGHS